MDNNQWLQEQLAALKSRFQELAAEYKKILKSKQALLNTATASKNIAETTPVYDAEKLRAILNELSAVISNEMKLLVDKFNKLGEDRWAATATKEEGDQLAVFLQNIQQWQYFACQLIEILNNSPTENAAEIEALEKKIAGYKSHKFLPIVRGVVTKISVRLKIKEEFIGDTGGGMINSQIKNYPYVHNYVQGHFKDKFLKDGKLDQKFKDAFQKFTGFTEQEIIGLMSDPEKGPTLYFYPLSQINIEHLYQDEKGNKHGYINGQTLYQSEEIEGQPGAYRTGNARSLMLENDDPRTDRSGVVVLDDIIVNALEFALGGNPNHHGNTTNVPWLETDQEELRKKNIETAELIFESTMLHEFVHWARFKNKLPNKLSTEEALKYGSPDPGKAFEVLFYGKDIAARIDTADWGELPVKTDNKEKNEHTDIDENQMNIFENKKEDKK